MVLGLFVCLNDQLLVKVEAEERKTQQVSSWLDEQDVINQVVGGANLPE